MGNKTHRRRFKTEKARIWALVRRIVLILLSLCLAGCIFIGARYLWSDLTTAPADDGKILPNVFVAGVNIGGMTLSNARNALHDAAVDSYSWQHMVVTLPDGTLILSPKDTGAKLDLDAVIEAAYNYGRDGSPAQNRITRKQAETKEHTIALLPYLDLDLSYLYNAVEAFCRGYSSEMVQTTVSLIGERPEYPVKPDGWDDSVLGPYEPDLESIQHQTMIITMGTPDFILEPKALYDSILDAYSLHNMRIAYQAPTLTEPDPLDLKALFQEYCLAPQDATMDLKTYKVTDEVYGYGFDFDSLAQLIEQAEYGQTLSVELSFLIPDITAEALAGDLFQETLAEYVSLCPDSYDANRNKNLRLACEAINGYVIKSGESFDFDAVLGPRTTDRGYLSAPMYSGSSATVLGGGISQIASALYYCALASELEITERHPHTYAVSYTPTGFDAAIAYNSQSLCFVNNTSSPIRIVAEAKGSTVTVALHGSVETREDILGNKIPVKDYYVTLENEVVAEYTYKTVYQPMTQDNPQGYLDGHALQKGIIGYDVNTYLCKFDNLTGLMISRELISSQHYEKRDEILVQISMPEPTEPGTSEPGVNPEDSYYPW